MKENHELKRVLSIRVSTIQGVQVCNFCSRELPKGSRAASYGVIDRRNRQWSRLYFCEDHDHILDNLNPEDLSLYHQEYLVEKGFGNETYS